MNFQRDYFLPFPTEDLSGTIQKPVDWAAASSISRALLLDLRTVSFEDDRWVQGPGQMFVAKQAVLHFSEHGDRNWSRSMAALFGISKAEGDYLGRWMPEQSDDYNRAAKQVVHRVQLVIAEACRKDPGAVDEDLGKLELRAFLLKKGVSEVDVVVQMLALSVVTPLGMTWSRRWSSQVCLDTCINVEEDSVHDGLSAGDECPVESDAIKEFYISFTLKKKFARLHRMGGCHRTPGKDVHSYLFVDSIHDESWDDFCRQCWRLGAFPGNERGDGSVDGSGSSSSDGSSSTDG